MSISEDLRTAAGLSGPEAQAEVAKNTSIGMELAETKWKDYFSGELEIRDPYLKSTVAMLLENTDRALRSGGDELRLMGPKGFMEDVRIANVGTFDKYVFPIIRALVPQLAATDLVSVQPMSGPTSLVFYLDYLYATTRGTITAGTSLFGTIDKSYSSETVEVEAYSTGTSATGPYTHTAAFLPVIPGTVTITETTTPQVVNDDGNGGVTGAASAGSVNYTTGAMSVTFSATAGTAPIVVTYDFDLEFQASTSQVDLIITSAPITARQRKLRARWGMEAQQDLSAIHGVDAETELTAAITNEIKFEIDQEIVRQIESIAYSPNTSTEVPVWDKNPPAGVAYVLHKESLKDIFVMTSTLINQRSRRATGNWIVAGDQVADIIETLSNFTPDTSAGLTRGVFRIGNLAGRWDIYRDQNSPVKQYIMGYKGPTFLEAGFVYAPYVPLYATPTYTLDDFISRKGLGTRYGKRVINSTFYVKNTINT